MPRKLAALVLLLVAVASFAKERSVTPAISAGSSVTGEVFAVNGNTIALAGGLIAIDATNAKILGDTAIKPGMLITATVNDSLVASAIAVIRSADVTLTGTVQSVGTSEFGMLGKSIKVNASTSWVNGTGLSSVQTNMVVIVEANVAAGALLASRVTLIAPIPPRPQLASGTVKAIGTDAWVITVKDHDLTFVVNAATKILGSPKAGDRVEVLYTVDSAHANVAISIIKSIEPPKVVKFSGVVKSIEAHYWIITRDDDHKDVKLTWPENVRLMPAVRVGDAVEVVATENGDGTYSLITIVPKR